MNKKSIKTGKNLLKIVMLVLTVLLCSFPATDILAAETAEEPFFINTEGKNPLEVDALKKLYENNFFKVDEHIKNLDAKDCYTWNENGNLTALNLKAYEVDFDDYDDYDGDGTYYVDRFKGRVSFAAFSELTSLVTGSGEITSLDVSKNKKLKVLNCSGNTTLGKLNLSKNKKLKVLKCAETGIKSLDLSHNLNLTELYLGDKDYGDDEFFGGNSITGKIDLSKNKKLTLLDCRNCYISSLNLDNNINLKELIFDLTEFGKTTTFDLSKCKKLTDLWCYETNVTSLTLGQGMKTIYCEDSELTSLDVSKCKKLKSLHCEESKLTSLDISKCKNLLKLECNNFYNRSITELKLNENLTYLDCSDNKLTTLDVSKCKNLTYLDCSGNKLTKLDLSNCTKLKPKNTYADKSVKILIYR